MKKRGMDVYALLLYISISKFQNMIIPIRCFTCGKVLANKYRYYQEFVADLKTKGNVVDDDGIPGQYYRPRQMAIGKETTPIRAACDHLKLERCCVKTMMTHVDIE